MWSLSAEQRDIVNRDSNIVVTACPGSGKTRVLTSRVLRALKELEASKQKVLALTFTNRAADEIKNRIGDNEVSTDQLWAGTFHSFALEWILRPYSPYTETTRYGFAVANEFQASRLLDEARAEHNLDRYHKIPTSYSRNETTIVRPAVSETDAAFNTYKAKLRERRLLDYDDVLFLAYLKLQNNPEIANTLVKIFRVFCVDEVQDLQDLQWAILSSMYLSTNEPPTLFFVGDPNQSIYESLGAQTKTPQEICDEFNLESIEDESLTGNYRSTQRIVDFCSLVRPEGTNVVSLADESAFQGEITFENQSIQKEYLADRVSELIQNSLQRGVKENEICVLAPQWWLVRPLARGLVESLPEVSFDAPGLSPLRNSPENPWFKIARIFLTQPTPKTSRSRVRWARETLEEITNQANLTRGEHIDTPRKLLRAMNAISSVENEGLAYLREVFGQFLTLFELSLETNPLLKESHEFFFLDAEARLAELPNAPSDVQSFRNFFSYPSGVVVNTCHGVKGEEFDTVIAVSLLKGYVPNWDEIINRTNAYAQTRESKLLYVICSRAKKHLHLISENGRRTQGGRPYETSSILQSINYPYD